MKGVQSVAILLPHRPRQNGSGSLIQTVGTHQAEIGWNSPEGGFTQYTLMAKRISRLHHVLKAVESNFFVNNDETSSSDDEATYPSAERNNYIKYHTIIAQCMHSDWKGRHWGQSVSYCTLVFWMLARVWQYCGVT